MRSTEESLTWYGPIVVNVQEQVRHACEEFRGETFLDSSASGKPVHGRVS
jgi:redox-sensitive bicupin YhaK (pirin superfamily)